MRPPPHPRPRPPPPPPRAQSESSYAFAITRTAVAQICTSIGFTTAETPALLALTDIAARFLTSLAASAAASAHSAGRTQSNLADAVAAVDHLSSAAGFAGAWNVTGCGLTSGAVHDLVRFWKYTDEIPFAKPLPKRIKRRNLKNACSNDNNSDEYIGGKWKHVPKWLPVMPVIKEEEKNGEKKNEIWGFCEKTRESFEWEKKMEENIGEITTRRTNPCISLWKEMRRENKGIELPLKRGKVRFKIENGGVVGVCKRVGIGKRVLCESWVGDDGENHIHNDMKKRILS